MSTPHLHRSATGLLAAIVCGLSIGSCADLARTGSGPAYLIMNGLTAGGAPSLNSDVSPQGGLLPVLDRGQATISAAMKNTQPTAPTASALNSITLNRYRVRFRRSDGQNREGVDVPYGFDGGVTITIPVGTAQRSVDFDLVRPQSKLEPPLRNLVNASGLVANSGGLIILSVIAEVTFYGSDQAGNEVSVTGTIDVRFADFP